MERGVALIVRVVAQRDGQIELERLVTPEMAERMRREATVESGHRSEVAGQASDERPAKSLDKHRPKVSGHHSQKILDEEVKQ